MEASASQRRKTTQTASHWGVYTVETDQRTHEVLETRGVLFDPHPSPIQASLPEVVHDSLRIDQPYVREGYLRSRGASRAERGSEGFVPIGWDDALDLVCEALLEARDQHGNESIYGGSYGWASAGRLHHAPSVLKRFLALLGGYKNFKQAVQAAVATREPSDERPVLQMAEDEGRFGLISQPRRAWAPPGIRPRSPRQIVREYAYVYAAVAPEEGKMTSLILPRADTAMMNLFLEHVAKTFQEYFIVMQVDQAGWHHAKDRKRAREHPLDPSTALQSRAQSSGASVGTLARKKVP